MNEKQYLNYLKKNNYSINTIITYKSILNIYKNDYQNITRIKNKIKTHFNSPNTAWTHYNVICSYMRWAKDKRLENLKEIKLPRISKVYRSVFKKSFLIKKTEIKAEDSEILIEKKIIIRFLFETGIRASELKNIIEIKEKTLKIIGKGNKIREIFHKIETTKLMNDFKYTTKTLRLWVKEILGENYTPHSIRRSYATHMLLAGANPKMVMLQLGHEKIETTFRYLNLSFEQNWQIYSKFL
ncbi:tyrosine-type recombinase/integrase [Williamsoniiplasma lucivorax]|uniref:Integrase n=1 Tax=Williamsoniiplasma lucivorax TaxID=209274 RepID=A0A2S5RFI0_9MOLU|nr:site-specific integrase [Williamsoniiplasma lucivorax]PPE06089.1 integrase [Williamsoniiplasma lucivorax]